MTFERKSEPRGNEILRAISFISAILLFLHLAAIPIYFGFGVLVFGGGAPVPRPFPRSNPNKPCPCTINAQVTNKAAYNLRNLAESGWERNGKPITEPFSSHFEAALYEYKYGKAAHDNLILKHNPSFAGESHLSEFDGPCSGLRSKIRTLGPQIIACQRNNQIVPKECSDALSNASNTLVRYCDPLGK